MRGNGDGSTLVRAVVASEDGERWPAATEFSEPATGPTTDDEPASGPTEQVHDPSGVGELVRRAAAGDQRAWNALVDRFASTVWAIARGYRLSEANAADVSQTTWLRLVEHLERIQQPERVGAWLATTARRESLRVLRMSARQLATGEDFDILPDPTPEPFPADEQVARDRDRILGELVGRLPSRCQLILRLLSADTPLRYRELSESLGMPIGSIGPTRGRCLEHLRRLALREGISLSDALDL
jgi:RNA polymerase sigma factor (sigma-70 family)